MIRDAITRALALRFKLRRPCHLVDVSRSQRAGSIDWGAFRRQGIRAVYVRASAGSVDPDPAALDHANGAKAAGLLIGYYHAASPDDHRRDPEREAEHFARCCAKLPAPDLIDMVDVERGIHAVEVATWTRRWAEANAPIEGLYVNPRYLRYIERHGYRHKGPLWLAHWRLDNPKAPLYSPSDVHGSPPPARKAELWQWTSSGKLDGYEGRLDLNYAHRGLAPLMRREA